MTGSADSLPAPEEDPAGVSRSGIHGMRALCHDLIGPAATIDILVQAVYAEGNPDPAIRHRLQLISSEARRISEICRQVLDRPIRAGSVRLDLLTADLLESARSRYLTTIEAVTSPVTLLVHPAVVARILGNLLANACQAAGPDGLVQLQVTPDGEQACVTVADSGAGFGIGKIGRDSLGLEIIGALVLDCGGTVQMGTSDLGGVKVAVTLPCLTQTLAPVRELGIVLGGSAGTWRDDADMPA